MDLSSFKVPISACLGPRGDGNVPGTKMTAEEARSLINDDSMNWISENDARTKLGNTPLKRARDI